MAKKIINALAEVDTAEVSLVTRGANRRRRFAMLKAEDSMDINEKIMKAVLEVEAENEGDLEKLAKEGKLSGKAVGAMKGILRIAQAFKDELPPETMKVLGKLAALEPGDDEEDAKPDEEEEKPEGELDKEEKPEGEIDMNLLKADGTLNIEAVPEALRPTVELMAKQATDDRTEITELRKSLDVEADARTDRETRELVEKEAPDAPGAKKEEIVSLLKGTTDKKARETLLSILRAASETAKESTLLKQLGNGAADISGGAWDQIVTIAKSLVAKDGDGLTEAEAINKVLADPKHAPLYDQYLAEKQQG